jgi:hypothetical protein
VLLVTEFVGFEGFIVNFVKRGDATVPFGRVAVLPTSLMACGYILSDRVEHLEDRGCRGADRIGRRAQVEPEGGSS